MKDGCAHAQTSQLYIGKHYLLNDIQYFSKSPALPIIYNTFSKPDMEQLNYKPLAFPIPSQIPLILIYVFNPFQKKIFQK